MNGNLETMQRYQESFVKPVVDALRLEIEGQLKPLLESQKSITGLLESHNTRIQRLEKDQKRALLGWSIYATGIGLACTLAWKWIVSKVR